MSVRVQEAKETAQDARCHMSTRDSKQEDVQRTGKSIGYKSRNHDECPKGRRAPCPLQVLSAIEDSDARNYKIEAVPFNKSGSDEDPWVHQCIFWSDGKV